MYIDTDKLEDSVIPQIETGETFLKNANQNFWDAYFIYRDMMSMSTFTYYNKLEENRKKIRQYLTFGDNIGELRQIIDCIQNIINQFEPDTSKNDGKSVFPSFQGTSPQLTPLGFGTTMEFKPVNPSDEKKEDALSKESTNDEVYVVVAGDTLGKIANKYGVTWQELAEYNNLADPNVIHVGQQIKIPSKEKKEPPVGIRFMAEVQRQNADKTSNLPPELQKNKDKLPEELKNKEIVIPDELKGKDLTIIKPPTQPLSDVNNLYLVQESGSDTWKMYILDKENKLVKIDLTKMKPEILFDSSSPFLPEELKKYTFGIRKLKVEPVVIGTENIYNVYDSMGNFVGTYSVSPNGIFKYAQITSYENEAKRSEKVKQIFSDPMFLYVLQCGIILNEEQVVDGETVSSLINLTYQDSSELNIVKKFVEDQAFELYQKIQDGTATDEEILTFVKLYSEYITILETYWDNYRQFRVDEIARLKKHFPNSELIKRYTEELAWFDVYTIYGSAKTEMQNAKIDWNKLPNTISLPQMFTYMKQKNGSGYATYQELYNACSKASNEQYTVICYYYAKYGYDKTMDFVTEIMPLINSEYAKRLTKDYEESSSLCRFFKGTGIAINAGIEDCGKAATGFLKMITHDTSYTFDGAYTMAFNNIMQIEDSELFKLWYNSARTITTQTIAAGFNQICPGFGLLFNVLLATGCSYVDATNDGRLYGDALAAAVLNGTAAFGTGLFLDTVAFKGLFSSMLDDCIEGAVSSPVAKGLTKDFAAIVSEVLEEEFENVIVIGGENAIYGENRVYSYDEATDTLYVTALSTFVLRRLGIGADNNPQNLNTNVDSNFEFWDKLLFDPKRENDIDYVFTMDKIYNYCQSGDISKAIKTLEGMGYKSEVSVLNALLNNDYIKAASILEQKGYTDLAEQILNENSSSIGTAKMFEYKVDSDERNLPNINSDALNNAKTFIDTIQGYDSSASVQFNAGLANVENLLTSAGYDINSGDGKLIYEQLSKYYKNFFAKTFSDSIWNSKKQVAKNFPGLEPRNIEHKLTVDKDGTLVMEFVANGKTIVTIDAIDFYENCIIEQYTDIKILFEHYQNEIKPSGLLKDPLKYFVGINEYTSAKEVVNNCTAEWLKKYESTFATNVKVNGKLCNYGFITTTDNLNDNSRTVAGRIIGYHNDNGSNTQWAMSLSSLQQKLTNKFTFQASDGSVKMVTKELLQSMSDADIVRVCEALIAVPYGSYDSKNIQFVAGQKNIDRNNMTSNSMQGANEYYAYGGQTANGILEADIGAVDLKDSKVSKTGVDGIRQMFIDMFG